MVSFSELHVRPIFGGHEKFVFRHGWLKKGADGVIDNPRIFADEEALVKLGVGKNMVRSIRHWCLATGLMEEKGGNAPSHQLQITPLGDHLLGDNGWDPFMEDIGSAWLLHWQLCTNRARGLVWHILFSRFLEIEFTKRQLANYLSSQFERQGIHATPGTLDREIDVCLRTYVPSIRTKLGAIAEETLDCPLAELEIVQYMQGDTIYRFNIGPKFSLPMEVFGYALLSFLSSSANTRRTFAVDECLYQEGSPGQIFKLDENSVVEYLEALEDESAWSIHLQETAGLRQIYLGNSEAGDLQDQGFRLLRAYYGRG